mmetsp:Transcript_4814/g.13925  ORF Transcript_4814/g.13925 Transcript_4814/m.13925 type:complete len:87 (+) Transcript_4814:1494-1754(+)
MHANGLMREPGIVREFDDSREATSKTVGVACMEQDYSYIREQSNATQSDATQSNATQRKRTRKPARAKLPLTSSVYPEVFRSMANV